MSKPTRIEWDEFVAKYRPQQNHIDNNAAFDGCMYETYCAELLYVQSVSGFRVWTVVETDSGNLETVNGYHHVNRMGYIITEEQWDGHAGFIEVYDE